jgi:predicted ATPase
LGAAVAGSALESESGRWLHQRTAGNALFVGEIIRTLRDTGRLEQIGDLCRIDPGAARRGVPLSLRALLGSRIDALPPSQRNALEVAAVIGRAFAEPLLTALCGGRCGDAELQELVEAGILARVEDPGQTEAQWRFRHQLYLDAAYGRLLADRRRLLHATLADLLESTETRPDVAELARHRIAAGDSVRAQPLLEQAAREAASVGAIAEAEGFQRTLAELRGEAATTVS